jgi:tetraacyldisaccharide 4'-kinase
MPFGYLYGAIANVRCALYEKGFFKSFLLGAPTISIGNITVGGTGKTPLVAFVTEILSENGEKVCILTPGYRRENSDKRIVVSDGRNILANVRRAGDEPFELARKLSGKAVIIADKNRAAAGQWAREKFGITAFVLDDGFQHLRVRRDLDIVCIDATNPFGNYKALPSGILRESLQNLSRADAIVITRANLAENLEELKSEISNLNKNCPFFISNNKISNLIELNEFHSKPQGLKTKDQKPKTEKSLAFCALGNPNNFFKQLKQNNFNITTTEIFSDHHFYTQNDIFKLESKAKQEKAEILLTTAKDGVKLEKLKFSMPCYVVENAPVFEDEQKFRQMIFETVRR